MKHFFLLLVMCTVCQKDVLAKKSHKKTHHEKSHGSKIVGGHDADIKDCPYQAYLLVDQGEGDLGNYYECGGSILNNRYILSAAHCFKEAKSATARIGSTNKFEGGQEFGGTYEYHKDYVRDTLDYDISYFKTDKEMILDGVSTKAVALIEKGSRIPSKTMIKISGWGATSEDGDDSETLRAVEVPTISNEECNQEIANYATERQFCGGYKEGGKDHCEGDSGGPAVRTDTNTLVGVVSGSVGCARPNTPGIYVNLTNPEIRSWISEHTGV